nr:3-beta hydroxysteroid-dehydrogenase/ decarboxylase-like isoform X1 [Tanacetum cinerariifolium]
MKLTLGAILALFAFYDNFVIPGYNMITAISMVFVMALAFLFLHGKVPDKLMGYSVDKIMESNFHITYTMSRQAALSVVSSWNHAACTLRSISSGTDSVIFFKTVLSLLILALIGSMSLQSFFEKDVLWIQVI